MMTLFQNRSRYFIAVIWMAVVLAFHVQALAMSEAPADAPSHTKALLGLYQGEIGRFLIRERDGILELLFDEKPGDDEEIKDYQAYPLHRITENAYSFNGNGPAGWSAAMIFERDAEDRGIACQVGAQRFSRIFYGPDKGQIFRIEPLFPADTLRDRAGKMKLPVEKGSFRNSELVEVVSLDSAIHLDIRYATENNFLGMPLYTEPRAFMQRPAAEALIRAQRKLAEYGYGLIIHDAYRPWYVTAMFWEATPAKQKDFVADPSKGSRHNRGCAVDISLYYLATGQPVAMISGYDEFSPRAYPDYPGGTTLERWQRDLLGKVMNEEGFSVYPGEWWHFDYATWRQYPIINLAFDEISN